MLIVLQRRRASIRLPRLAVDDFNHTVTRYDIPGIRTPNLSIAGGVLYRSIYAELLLTFYAEVLLTYISRLLSQRNNTYFQSKEQWHPAEDPINTWHSSSIGRALDRQTRGSGFGSPECHIYRVTVWLKSSTANRGKHMLALLRWSTINPRTGGGLSQPRTGGGGLISAPPLRYRELRNASRSGKRR